MWSRTEGTGRSIVFVHGWMMDHRDAWSLVGKLPRATFVVLDRAEHGLPIDQQRVFAALVRDWLARVAEQRAR